MEKKGTCKIHNCDTYLCGCNDCRPCKFKPICSDHIICGKCQLEFLAKLDEEFKRWKVEKGNELMLRVSNNKKELERVAKITNEKKRPSDDHIQWLKDDTEKTTSEINQKLKQYGRL